MIPTAVPIYNILTHSLPPLPSPPPFPLLFFPHPQVSLLYLRHDGRTSEPNEIDDSDDGWLYEIGMDYDSKEPRMEDGVKIAGSR